jgi:quinol monooxygenase YgiN
MTLDNNPRFKEAVVIHVIATIEVVAGKRGQFLAEFRQNVAAVKAENGCLEYGPAVDLQTDIAAQIPLRPHVVTVVEKWESLDALKAHLTAPHMLSFRARVKEIVVKISLQVLQPG